MYMHTIIHTYNVEYITEINNYFGGVFVNVTGRSKFSRFIYRYYLYMYYVKSVSFLQ